MDKQTRWAICQDVAKALDVNGLTIVNHIKQTILQAMTNREACDNYDEAYLVACWMEDIQKLGAQSLMSKNVIHLDSSPPDVVE